MTGHVRASASLRRAAGAFDATCDAGRRSDLFGLPGDGSVAVNLDAACGMLADIRVTARDTLGRTTASLQLGGPRLGGADPGAVLLIEPGMAMPPSVTGSW